MPSAGQTAAQQAANERRAEAERQRKLLEEAARLAKEREAARKKAEKEEAAQRRPRTSPTVVDGLATRIRGWIK